MRADEKLLSGRGVVSYSVGLTKGAAKVGQDAPRRAKQPAKKTVIHEAIWRAHGLPVPQVEFRFHVERKWRFDYAWPHRVLPCQPLSPYRKVAVEIQGGLFNGGGHVRGKHLIGEYEKLNEAQLAGWVVLMITPDQIKDGSAFELIRRALM